MELMDKSLDKLYQLVYKKLNEKIPEVIVGKMADSVSERKNESMLLELRNKYTSHFRH